MMQERLIQTRYLNPISRLAAEESRVSRMLRMERSHCILQKVNRSRLYSISRPRTSLSTVYFISFAYGVVEKLQRTTKNLTHLCSNDPVNEFHSSKDMSCFLAFDRLLDGENFKEARALSSYYLEGRSNTAGSESSTRHTLKKRQICTSQLMDTKAGHQLMSKHLSHTISNVLSLN